MRKFTEGSFPGGIETTVGDNKILRDMMEIFKGATGQIISIKRREADYSEMHDLADKVEAAYFVALSSEEAKNNPEVKQKIKTLMFAHLLEWKQKSELFAGFLENRFQFPKFKELM